MPARKDFECRGCRWAETTLLPVCRNNYENVTYQFLVYCQKKRINIKYPQEHCENRDPVPRLTLNEYR